MSYNLNFWYLLVEVLIFTHKSGCSQIQKVVIRGFFLKISMFVFSKFAVPKKIKRKAWMKYWKLFKILMETENTLWRLRRIIDISNTLLIDQNNYL